MNRRSFLQSLLAAGVAPAVVGSGVLMPIRAIDLSEYTVRSVAFGGVDGVLVLPPVSGLVYSVAHDRKTLNEVSEWMLHQAGNPPDFEHLKRFEWADSWA